MKECEIGDTFLTTLSSLRVRSQLLVLTQRKKCALAFCLKYYFLMFLLGSMFLLLRLVFKNIAFLRTYLSVVEVSCVVGFSKEYNSCLTITIIILYTEWKEMATRF